MLFGPEQRLKENLGSLSYVTGEELRPREKECVSSSRTRKSLAKVRIQVRPPDSRVIFLPFDAPSPISLFVLSSLPGDFQGPLSLQLGEMTRFCQHGVLKERSTVVQGTFDSL